tara:strand:+ start:19583 stop:20350 length:768 start_codon:yes stop_codon:yes gene_type:complete
MSNLKDVYISDSYTGLLHTDTVQLTGGKTTIFDGAGNKSSMMIGSEGAGASISGQLSAGGFEYPISDLTNGLLVSDGNFKITLQSLQSLLATLGSNITDGRYTNPTITFTNGIITDIASTTLDITSNDPSETVYTNYTDGITYVSDVEINPTDWTPALLPNYIPSHARAIIGYVTAGLVSNRQTHDIRCSVNDGETYTPVFYLRGGEDSGGSSDTNGLGVQFHMFTNGSDQVSFKDFGNTGQTNTFEFHVIAYQY